MVIKTYTLLAFQVTCELSPSCQFPLGPDYTFFHPCPGKYNSPSYLEVFLEKRKYSWTEEIALRFKTSSEVRVQRKSYTVQVTFPSALTSLKENATSGYWPCMLFPLRKQKSENLSFRLTLFAFLMMMETYTSVCSRPTSRFKRVRLVP